MGRLPVALAVVLALAPASSAGTGETKCPPDAVAVGPACVDRFEASLWRVPAANRRLIASIRKGKATLPALAAGGATRAGNTAGQACSGDEYGRAFPPTGTWSEPLYAVSLASVSPSTCVTWFQAEQACRLSGKRLPSNQEWQAAASGIPDPGLADDGATTCATDTFTPPATGSRPACVSRWGTYDMVGGVWEWVADWTEQAAACASWGPALGDDDGCMGSVAPPPAVGPAALRAVPVGAPRAAEPGEPAPNLPAAVVRGGDSRIAPRSGVFAISAGATPTVQRATIGFRCVR